MLWLYIVGGIVLFILIVMSLPITVGGCYNQQGSTLFIKWLFINKTVLPIDKEELQKKKEKKQKKKLKKEKKAQKKGKTTDKTKESSVKKLLKHRGPTEFLELMAAVIGAMCRLALGILRRTKFTKFKLDIRVGGDDAADIAFEYGKICAVTYPALGLLYANTNMKNPTSNILADYNSPDTTVDFEAVAKLPIGLLVITVLSVLPKIIKEII